MSDKYIQLKDPNGNLLFPRTYWNQILNTPSVATTDQLASKQDRLTSANSGTGITITRNASDVVIISCNPAFDYTQLQNRPTLNGVTITGAQTSSDFNIPSISNTTDGAFELADQSGNVALRLINGHLVTKYFDSSALDNRFGALSTVTRLSSDVSTLQSTKLNTSALDSSIQALGKYLKYSVSNNVYSIVANSTTLFTYDTINGLTVGSFISGNVNSTLTAHTTAITELQGKVVNKWFDTSQSQVLLTGFNLAGAPFVTQTSLTNQLATKQDKLTAANAGNNITITTVDNVIKISSTASGSGGVSNYSDLTNKPALKLRDSSASSIEINGTHSLGYYGIPFVDNDSNYSDLSVADENGYVIMHVTGGHIRTKYFDSSTISSIRNFEYGSSIIYDSPYYKLSKQILPNAKVSDIYLCTSGTYKHDLFEITSTSDTNYYYCSKITHFADYQSLLLSVPGYDATHTQTLQNINGSFQWVNTIWTQA